MRYDYNNNNNCMAACKDRLKSANDVCFSYKSMESCINTNPYPNGGTCGYGAIPKKKGAFCSKCRCQYENGVCFLGAKDNNCNPSMNQ